MIKTRFKIFFLILKIDYNKLIVLGARCDFRCDLQYKLWPSLLLPLLKLKKKNHIIIIIIVIFIKPLFREIYTKN